jgi:ribonuclease T2
VSLPAFLHYIKTLQTSRGFMRHPIFENLIVIYLILTGLPASVEAGFTAPANGIFVAAQTCEAYVSKNKGTNPDHYRLSVNRRYDIMETTGTGNNTWFRIRVSDATPNARWVAKSCGSAAATSADTGEQVSGTASSNRCDIADKGDSYVLAVSWQPAFCMSHTEKPECSVTDAQAYQASHFTLHGLWPNQAAQCGTHYGYCGEVKTQPQQFCDYPQVNLSQPVRNDLAVVMPSVAAGTCLERHEWFKHGTCQTQWHADAYFEIAIRLTKQLNDSGLAAFMAAHSGQPVSQTDFISRVDEFLGANAHERLHLTCKNGKLVDVFIDLSGKLEATQKLAELIAQAPSAAKGFSSNCNGQFGVQSGARGR